MIVESFRAFLTSNPLHPGVFPAVRKMEAEVSWSPWLLFISFFFNPLNSGAFFLNLLDSGAPCSNKDVSMTRWLDCVFWSALAGGADVRRAFPRLGGTALRIPFVISNTDMRCDVQC